MNMQSSITAAGQQDPLASLHHLLVVALALVDELSLPGRIGADIDFAIHSASALLLDRGTAPLIS